MDLSFNLAPSYRDLKDLTSRKNFEDTPGQIPKLILTLRPMPLASVTGQYQGMDTNVLKVKIMLLK